MRSSKGTKGQVGGDRTSGRVHGRQWIHHHEVCAAIGAKGEETEHEAKKWALILLPVARCIETSVNTVMVAPMEGSVERQDVDEKMDEELAVEDCWSGAETWRTPHQRSDQPTRERTCRFATGVSTTSHAERPTRAARSSREPKVSRRWCRSITSSLGRGQRGVWRSAAEQVATRALIITIFMATFCGRRAVAVRQCSTRAIAYFAAFK